MGLLLETCSSSSGWTWRLQSACKLLANLTSLVNKTRRSIAKHHNDQKSSCCNELPWSCRSTHKLMKVSITHLKTASAHIVWVVCQFECRSHQAHRCMFPHFRPPVTLSTMSSLCCRSRCRPVSSWCGISLLTLVWVGVGVFICGHGHMAKTWRTVGQNLTKAGLKSDVWAKMKHTSVIW